MSASEKKSFLLHSIDFQIGNNAPSALVLVKRELVKTEEPFSWRSVSIVLLSIIMGLQQRFGTQQDLFLSSLQHQQFVTFLQGLQSCIQATSQTTKAELLDFFQGLYARKSDAPLDAEEVDALQSEVDANDAVQLKGLEHMRQYILSAKYEGLVDNGTIQSMAQAEEFANVLKAGSCVQGICQ